MGSVKAQFDAATGTIKISRRSIGNLRRRLPEIERDPFLFTEKLGLRRQKKLTFEQLHYLRMNFPAVNTCIDFIKNRIFSFNFRIVRTEGSKKHNNFSRKRAERARKALIGPNQFGHTYRMNMSMFADNLLERDLGTGELEPYPAGGIKQWGVIESSKMRPNPENFSGDLSDYAYFEMDEMMREKIVNKYKKNEIMWANLNPQAGSFYGLAPLEVLDTIILMSIYADRHNLKLVHPNSEKGGGIIWLGDVGKEVREEFEERYSLFRTADPGRPMFTSGGDVSPVYLGLRDERDLEWEELKLAIAEMVASSFQLNLRDIGISSKKGAAGTAEIEDIITMKSAILPRMLLLQDILTVGIVHEAGGDDLALEYILRKDESLDQKSRAASMALGRGVININEYREMIDDTLEKLPPKMGEEHIVIAGNNVFKLKDILSGKVNPLEKEEKIEVERDGAGEGNGSKEKVDIEKFKRTTQSQTNRGADQNWS